MEGHGTQNRMQVPDLQDGELFIWDLSLENSIARI
jgi:hypothetical protein